MKVMGLWGKIQQLSIFLSGTHFDNWWLFQSSKRVQRLSSSGPYSAPPEVESSHPVVSLYVVKNLRLRSNRTVHRSKQTNKKKIPSFSKPLGPQRLLYFASKTSLGYKRLFHDFSESVGSIPKFLMHAPCNNEPKDISTAFQTKQMLEKSSGQYLGVLIRFRDEPWWKTPSCKISQCYPRFECMPQVVRNLRI